jgi:hypothetical protein
MYKKYYLLGRLACLWCLVVFHPTVEATKYVQRIKCMTLDSIDQDNSLYLKFLYNDKLKNQSVSF